MTESLLYALSAHGKVVKFLMAICGWKGYGVNMKKICDSHVHSNNSFDAESSVREICETAVKKGLDTVTITDHMEAPEIRFGDKSVFGNAVKSITKSVSDVEKNAPEFKGRLRLLKGMELGEPMYIPEMTERAMAIADFDFILASIHNLKEVEDFYYLEYNEGNVDNLLKRYFDELLDTAENADFDSLAHLTYPLRYIIERTDIRPDLNVYGEVIDNIFKALIKRNKALEVNTSGLFKPINSTLPSADLVKRFKQLGGKYVTIGSDAHNAKDLAQGIQRGTELVKACGFEHYTVYVNRTPELIEI